MRIGLISDTHGEISNKILDFLKDCDEVWHAGDIGNHLLPDILEKAFTFRAVYGNIDDARIYGRFPEYLSFQCEDISVVMIHIGGYPGRYSPKAKKLIQEINPDLFISGHSHILKIIYDQEYRLLHMNPGSAGRYGIHQLVTAIRFEINGKLIEKVDIFELKKSEF